VSSVGLFVTEARTELLEYEYLKVVLVFVEPISEITGRVPTEREYRDLWKSDCIEEFMFLFPGCQQGPVEEWVQLLWYLQLSSKCCIGDFYAIF
jgi:hypothetical protein